MRRSPLKPKRKKPRRNEGRVKHGRIKEKQARPANTQEARHIAHVAGLGCLICSAPAEVHHILHAPGKQRKRDHRFVAPLCAVHHRGDAKQGGVHGLGGESAFREYWGVDLVGWAMAAWSFEGLPEASFWQDSVARWREVARLTLRL